MRLALLLLAALLLAGCFGGDEAATLRHVSAQSGRMTMGWDYAGENVVPAAVTLEGTLDDAANAGNVTLSGLADGIQFEILFDTFAQAEGKDFQDGGIAFDLDEHGDTGVADASIPRIHATIAAWGTARVSVDGSAQTDAWIAHLMVARDTVRGTDGKITKADGTTPYDPNTPGDARRIEGDPQAILWIKDPRFDAGPLPPTNVSLSLTCQAPQCDTTGELGLDEDAIGLTLNVTATAIDPTLPLGPIGQGRLTIVDANGTELAGTDVTPSPQPVPTGTLVVPLTDAVFPLTARLTGGGAFQVRLDGAAVMDSPDFVVFTWDEPVVEDR